MDPGGGGMAEPPILRQRADQLVAAAKRAQRQPAAQRLRHYDDIRHTREMFETEELAGAAKAGQHLIENEDRARTIASLTQRADESRLSDTHSALCPARLAPE